MRPHQDRDDMMDRAGSMESLLSGAGVALAAAVLMIIVFTLFRSTAPANETIALQSIASGICGDIGTAAISSAPCCFNKTYPASGITIKITSDYVIASDENGREFARALPVRVYPGAYRSGGQALWSDTAGMSEYLNRTFGSPGTAASPLNRTAGSAVTALMEQARREIAATPLDIRSPEPLKIEKRFLHIFNDTSLATEVEPYVFVSQ